MRILDCRLLRALQISGRRCGRIVSCECGGLCRFHGARCGSLGCGLCKILRGLCNLPGADHPGGHAELRQPVPTTDANRPIQHSRLRHAGMPPVRPARGLASHVILDRPSKRFTSRPTLTRIRQVIARARIPRRSKALPCMHAGAGNIPGSKPFDSSNAGIRDGKWANFGPDCKQTASH